MPKSFTPGPGEYLAPTAFGQYVSKIGLGDDNLDQSFNYTGNNVEHKRICK